ncbi:flavodoxin, partial [Oleiphilus sp. HI0061]
TASKKLLIVAHAPSPNLIKLVDATIKGASVENFTGIEVNYLKPLDTQSSDIISADAIIIGTTENLGYMSGLIKDVFDRCYYDCLETTQGKPFAYFIRAGHDGTGTKRAIDTITTGLRWRLIKEPLLCKGPFQEEFVSQCEELGLFVAASLDAGII